MEDNLLEHKKTDSYSEDIKKTLDIISFDPKNSQIFGSFAFKALRFPTDIDTIEDVEVCCSEDKLINQAEREIKNVVKRVMREKGYYFGELKAGSDLIYLYVIPTNIHYQEKLITFSYADYKIIKDRVKILLDNGLITKQEFNEMSQYIKPKMTHDDFEYFYEILRNKDVIRWNDKEVLEGYKKLMPEGTGIHLNNALRDDAITKIDIWCPINNKYTEISNFWLLSYRDSKKKIHHVNHDPAETEGDLIADTIKFMTGVNYKPYKFAKRLWSLALFMDDVTLIKQLTPLLNSDAARLNVISGELSTVKSILKNVKQPPMNMLIKQIDNFKNSIAFVKNIKIDEEYLYKRIDKIVNNYKNMTVDQIIKYLEEMKEYLLKIIGEYARKYLDEMHLYPIPIFYFKKYLIDVRNHLKDRSQHIDEFEYHLHEILTTKKDENLFKQYTFDIKIPPSFLDQFHVPEPYYALLNTLDQ